MSETETETNPQIREGREPMRGVFHLHTDVHHAYQYFALQCR